MTRSNKIGKARDGFKFCNSCAVELPHAAFGYREGGKALRYNCKKCKAEYMLSFRAKAALEKTEADRLAQLAQQKVWREKNREYLQAYKDGRRDKMRQNTREWMRQNPGRARASRALRRARLLGASGCHTHADVARLLKLQKCQCPVCKGSLKGGYHVDHVLALSRGGSNDKSNIQLLCARCNLAKHAKDQIHFMQSRGFLL